MWPVFAAREGNFKLYPFAKAGAMCSSKLIPHAAPPGGTRSGARPPARRPDRGGAAAPAVQVMRASQAPWSATLMKRHTAAAVRVPSVTDLLGRLVRVRGGRSRGECTLTDGSGIAAPVRIPLGGTHDLVRDF